MTVIEEQSVRIGDFLREKLVTDTVLHEVIGMTARTITVRRTKDAIGEDGHALHMGDYPSVYTAQISDPDGVTQTLRLRKDGTYRIGESAGVRPLQKIAPKRFPDGNEYPWEYTDYSF